MLRVSVFALLLLSLASWVSASEFDQGRSIVAMPDILKPRQRIAPVNDSLKERLDTLLPALMREVDIDMWLVINREYVEDPVYFSLVPEPVFAARRTTILVFFDKGPEKGVERLTVSRYGLAGLYDVAWDGGTDKEQFKQLATLIKERNPKKIGINKSESWAFGDGLSAGLGGELLKVLDQDMRARLVSAEKLAIRWLETRTSLEKERYPHVVAIARRVIAQAFSNQTITPGVTTTDDVAWFIRERFEQLGLKPWFQPYVNVQRKGLVFEKDQAFFGQSSTIIKRGDVLHTDVGICYLRLCTDTQEMGYVLNVDESDVPPGLKKALALGNQWQDILTREFKTGRTGNDILMATQKACQQQGISANTYTHPIGYYGHAPGPTIGMWDTEQTIPVRGDWPLYNDTAYAIEGSIKTTVPEWDEQWLQIKLEQSAIYSDGVVRYLAGRQTDWHIVH